MSSNPSASSARKPTGHPDRYLIPRDHVPAGVAERVTSPREPVPARPAATIVLARAASAGPEVLLVRRPSRSSFAANAWVFPGGMVDPGDASDIVASRISGPPPEWWARRLGTPAKEAIGFMVAALREAWEETGILLSSPLRAVPDVGPTRAELLNGDIALADALEREGLNLDAREVVYLAHWITPEPESRRYDTRFFLAPVPGDSCCGLMGDELTGAQWVAPSDAVAAYESGDLWLLPPTVHTLKRLASYRSVEQMVAELRDAPVQAILPRMYWEGDGLIIQIPGT